LCEFVTVTVFLRSGGVGSAVCASRAWSQAGQSGTSSTYNWVSHPHRMQFATAAAILERRRSDRRFAGGAL